MSSDWAEEYRRRHPEAMRYLEDAIEKERQMRDVLEDQAKALEEAISESERLSDELSNIDVEPLEKTSEAVEEMNLAVDAAEQYWRDLNAQLKFLFRYPEVVANINDALGTSFKSVEDIVEYLKKIEDPIARWREMNRIVKVGDEFWRDYHDSLVMAQLDFRNAYMEAKRLSEPRLWSWMMKHPWRPEPYWDLARAMRMFREELELGTTFGDALAETWRKSTEDIYKNMVAHLDYIGRTNRYWRQLGKGVALTGYGGALQSFNEALRALEGRLPTAATYFDEMTARALSAGRALQYFGPDQARINRLIDLYKKQSETIKEVDESLRGEGVKEAVEQSSKLMEVQEALRRALEKSGWSAEDISGYFEKLKDVGVSLTEASGMLGTSLYDLAKKYRELTPAQVEREQLRLTKAFEDLYDQLSMLSSEEFSRKFETIAAAFHLLRGRASELDVELTSAFEKAMEKAPDVGSKIGKSTKQGTEAFEEFSRKMVDLLGSSVVAVAPYLKRFDVGIAGWLERIKPEERFAALLNWAKKWHRMSEEEVKTARRVAELSKNLKIMGGAAFDASEDLKKLEEAEAKFRMMLEQSKDKITETDRAHRRMVTTLGRFGRELSRLGRRIGFYGWILSYAGRSTLRMYQQVWRSLSGVVRVGADWERTMDQMATALSLAEASGLDLSETAVVLAGSFDKLMGIGLQTQAVWLGIQGLFNAVALSFTESLIPALTNFSESLAEIVSREDFQLWIQQIASLVGDVFLPSLLTMVENFRAVWPAIEPAVRAFMQVFTVISPVLPLVTMLGTALWLLGPAATAAGAAISIVNTLLMAKSAAADLAAKKTFENVVSERGLAAALLGAMKVKLMNLLVTKQTAQANAEAAATTTAHAVAAVKASSALATATKAIVGILATAGSLILMFMMLQKVWKSFQVSATKASFDVSASTLKMSKNVVDRTGRVVYSIDLVTGEVKDFSGTVIGYYDSMSSVVVSRTGEVIGVLDEASSKFVDASGEIVGSVSEVSGVFESLRETSESLKSLERSFSESSENMVKSLSVMEEEMSSMMVHMAALTAVQIGAMYGPWGILAGVIAAAVIEMVEYLVGWQNVLKQTQQVFGGFCSSLRRAWEDLMNWVTGGLYGFQKIWEDTFGRLFGHSIDKPFLSCMERIREGLEETSRSTASFMESLSQLESVSMPDLARPVLPEVEAGGALEAGRAEIVQHVTIYPVINIENISSEFDLDEVREAVESGIVEALRSAS